MSLFENVRLKNVGLLSQGLFSPAKIPLSIIQMKNLAGKKFILQKSEFNLQMNEVHSRHFEHSCPFQTVA
jgi:hypothetical protein